MSIPSPSVLDRLIPPEIKGDAFYQLLRILVADASVRTLLEIGASDGQGSTEALIAGMRANPSRPVLHTIEVSRARFTALSRRYANEPGVTCHNVSSVAADAFASDAEVSDFHRSTPSPLNQFPLEQVLAWRREDLAYLESAGVEQRGIEQIKRESGIVHFDLVLIDGSEFTGPAELDAVYGANLILLDDTETLKNRANLLRLLNDTGYCLLVHDRTVRNGYAAFRKRTFRAANYASIRPAVERVQGLLVDGQDEFLFNKAASLPNDAVIVEIGAYKGRSTVALAHACIGTDRRIYSIDTWDGNDKDFSERNFFDQWKSNVDASGLSDYVTPLRGRSRDVLPQLAARLGGAKIDFAFIDGSHDFDDVMSDLRQTLPLVKTGGWIALHDVIHTWPGPLRAWHKFARPALANHAYSTTLACGQTLKTSVETLEALIAKPVDPLPVHFFTIVLNGEPFIRHHIEQFKQLPFEWHWHIVEGLADLKHDTAWSLRTGGRIPAEFHRNGRSIDGTSEYLDRLASEFADRVTVYRKPPDALWDGKREM